MRTATILVFAASLAPVLFAQSAGCPPTAVYLALGSEVRGYPANANGKVAPCQRIVGSATNLQSANSIAVSKNGLLHVNQFNNNGDLTIYAKAATGNAAPTRTVFSGANDLIDNAIDSRVNDYTLLGFTSTITVFVSLEGATKAFASVNDAALSYGGSIAIDPSDNLLIEGYDQTGEVVIDTYATSQTFENPKRIRRLAGHYLGLPLAGQRSQFTNNISMAVDPQNGELYVYSQNSDASAAKISVFRAEGSGNIEPIRVISGAATQLNVNNTGFYTGSARIAVSAEGRLFVSEAENTILVFAPGANGNVAPSQVIEDSTGPVTEATLTFLGGIAVRSCVCHY